MIPFNACRNVLPMAVVLLAALVAGAEEPKPAQGPAPAVAGPGEISLKLLLGTWKGQMVTVVDGKAETEDVTMEFLAEGKFRITSDKPEESTFAIEKNTIRLLNPEKNGEDIIMSGVLLDANSLKASLAMSGVELPPNVKISVSLTRQTPK